MGRHHRGGRVPPHPLVSCGTPPEQNGGVHVPERVERRVEEIFSEALQETDTDRLSVGSESYSVPDASTPMIDLFVQFHNFRAWYRFSRENFTSEKPVEPTPSFEGGVGWNPAYTHSTLNHGHEDFFDRVYGVCSVTLKKRFAVVRNHAYGKRWHRVRAASVKDAVEQIQALRDELVQGAERSLRAILTLHGGSSSYVLDREPDAEIKVRGDDFISQIPANMVIHAEPVFKKVYKLPNIEFLGAEYVKNFIESRAIDRVAPDIASALSALAESVSEIPSRLERRRNPWVFMMNHAAEFNEINKNRQAGTAWLRRMFG